MLLSVKSKVVVSILALSIIGLISITYYLSNTLHKLSNENNQQSLKMLSESIFQTMTTSMMLGDPEVVQHAFRNAKKIEGIEDLEVTKFSSRYRCLWRGSSLHKRFTYHRCTHK